jgi:hypothetical protein
MTLLRMPSLLRSHPATEDRIRRLLAMLPPADRGFGVFACRAGSVDRGDLLLDSMPLTLII